MDVMALTTPHAWAQPQRRPRTPNDTLRSVEVAPDHKVTFRIYAPKVSEVSVRGDFGDGNLTKDDQGVWSITVGPLPSAQSGQIIQSDVENDVIDLHFSKIVV
jgi:1,4-alpha-glucan branching enzyme